MICHLLIASSPCLLGAMFIWAAVALVMFVADADRRRPTDSDPFRHAPGRPFEGRPVTFTCVIAVPGSLCVLVLLAWTLCWLGLLP